MWVRIAKAVDIAMAAEAPDKIEEYQVEYIINAIANCRTLPRVQLESQIKNTEAKHAPQLGKHTSEWSFSPPEISSLPDKPQTWASVAA